MFVYLSKCVAVTININDVQFAVNRMTDECSPTIGADSDGRRLMVARKTGKPLMTTQLTSIWSLESEQSRFTLFTDQQTFCVRRDHAHGIRLRLDELVQTEQFFARFDVD